MSKQLPFFFHLLTRYEVISLTFFFFFLGATRGGPVVTDRVV